MTDGLHQSACTKRTNRNLSRSIHSKQMSLVLHGVTQSNQMICKPEKAISTKVEKVQSVTQRSKLSPFHELHVLARVEIKSSLRSSIAHSPGLNDIETILHAFCQMAPRLVLTFAPWSGIWWQLQFTPYSESVVSPFWLIDCVFLESLERNCIILNFMCLNVNLNSIERVSDLIWDLKNSKKLGPSCVATTKNLNLEIPQALRL